MTVCTSIHVAVKGIISVFFMAEYYSIVHMYHIFILSSVDKHLGCFHILAIVNSAALNVGMHLFLQIVVLSRACPGVELPDHMVTLVLVLKDPPYCSP